MSDLPDSPPSPVIQHFSPHSRGLSWRLAPAGFSGARVWRGERDGIPLLALKAWPIGVAPDRVRQVHAWMRAAGQLPFVPGVFPNARGETVCVEAGRAWDCCRWLLGEPCTTATEREVVAACEAVACLHDAWSTFAESGPCPGVRNRLQVLADTEPLWRAGPTTLPPVSLKLDPLLRRAVIISGRVAPALARELQQGVSRKFSLQPCLRDLRASHVLFEFGAVSGIIDYGAMAVDHPAIDLARLLADFAGTNDGLFRLALNAYRRVCDRFDVPDELVLSLSRAGVICSALRWVTRLALQHEAISDEASIVLRLTVLVNRMEQFVTR